MGKPLFDFDVLFNSHNRGKYTSILQLVQRLHWKIQLCAHTNLGGKLCNYFLRVTSNAMWKLCSFIKVNSGIVFVFIAHY